MKHDQTTSTRPKKRLRNRVLSAVLAGAMTVMGIPADFASMRADAWGFGGFGFRPADVMTNAEVSFYDSSGKIASSIPTGETFAMRVSMSSSNVYQFGFGTVYTVTIDDPNILLPQFAGSGTKSGAKYNGFTLTVNTDGTRTLTYTLQNGQTKEIDLQMKWKNGVTPDDTTLTATLGAFGSFTQKKATVTADAEVKWDDSKSATPTVIDIGSPIAYTLKAESTATADTGVVFAEKVVMTDRTLR